MADNVAYLMSLFEDVLEEHGQDASLASELAADTHAEWSEDDASKERFLAGLDRIAKTLGRLDWGLLVGRNIELAALGASGYAAMSAPTLLHSFRLLVQFGPLFGWFYQFDIHERGVFVELEFTPMDVPGALEEGLADIAFCSLCAQVFGLYPMRKAEIQLGYAQAESQYHQQRSEFFPGRISYGNGVNRLRVPAYMCSEASVFHDPEVWELALASCKKQLSMVSYSPVTRPVAAVNGQIESAIARNVRNRPHCEPLPNITDVAKALRMSEIALRRSLQAEGQQFRQLKEDCRKRWARELLVESELPVQLVGFVLGYQDASNFSRSCHAWFGASPRQVRAGEVAGGDS